MSKVEIDFNDIPDALTNGFFMAALGPETYEQGVQADPEETEQARIEFRRCLRAGLQAVSQKIPVALMARKPQREDSDCNYEVWASKGAGDDYILVHWSLLHLPAGSEFKFWLPTGLRKPDAPQAIN